MLLVMVVFVCSVLSNIVCGYFLCGYILKKVESIGFLKFLIFIFMMLIWLILVFFSIIDRGFIGMVLFLFVLLMWILL